VVVNIYEAKTQLSRLLREVAMGREVVIARDGMPLARLVPHERRQHRAIRRGYAVVMRCRGFSSPA
jgi:prevent-host-death family protein